ncbi:MAG: ATP-binding cassette domain-containing protein [Rhabdaerophilum sp.]
MALALALPEETLAEAFQPALRIQGLRKAFGARTILDGLDLDVEPGTAVALIGANGAGKSTMLRMLVRLIEPDAGRMTLLGEPVTELAPGALRAFRRRVGIVFQRHNLVGRLSALSNVLHGVQARRAAASLPLQRYVLVHVNTLTTVILPDRDVPLGAFAPGDRLVARERMGPAGITADVEKVSQPA